MIAVTVDLSQARYANFVIGPQQLLGHKTTGWPQLFTAVGDNLPGIVRPIGAAYVPQLRGYIKGVA